MNSLLLIIIMLLSIYRNTNQKWKKENVKTGTALSSRWIWYVFQVCNWETVIYHQKGRLNEKKRFSTLNTFLLFVWAHLHFMVNASCHYITFGSFLQSRHCNVIHYIKCLLNPHAYSWGNRPLQNQNNVYNECSTIAKLYSQATK